MFMVLRIDRLRFLLCCNEGAEPAHVHITGEPGEAKYWLDPIGLASNYGFEVPELQQIERILVANHDRLMQAWGKYLGGA
ncbi:MAG TPA: DUF4160 domain-containing protein [Pirellulales bacterium]|nr:DUF4160 domain-containing protein [Pirellulales bacterium]